MELKCSALYGEHLGCFRHGCDVVGMAILFLKCQSSAVHIYKLIANIGLLQMPQVFSYLWYPADEVCQVLVAICPCFRICIRSPCFDFAQDHFTYV